MFANRPCITLSEIPLRLPEKHPSDRYRQESVKPFWGLGVLIYGEDRVCPVRAGRFRSVD